MPKIITNILWSLLILALLIFCTSLIERYTILTRVDYKLLIVTAIWIIALWIGVLIISELKSYNKPDSLICKITADWKSVGSSFLSLENFKLMLHFNLVLYAGSAGLLEEIGWEYKNVLIPPVVIISLTLVWTFIAFHAVRIYKKDWSELIHPKTKSKDHKSSRKRLLDVSVLVGTYYIFVISVACISYLNNIMRFFRLVEQEYLIFIILIGMLASFGMIYFVRCQFSELLSLVGVPESMAPSTKSKEHKSSLKQNRKVLRESILSHPFNKLSVKQLNRRTLVQLQKILKDLSEAHGKNKKFIEPAENTVEIKKSVFLCEFCGLININPADFYCKGCGKYNYGKDKSLLELKALSGEEITCVNCSFTQQRSATELCSNCGLSLFDKNEYQICTNCGSEFDIKLANCPICGSA